MEQIHVAVGVIYNETQDSVLIARRGDHQHLAGYWEFPGGKLHPGETTSQALQRELQEELGIHVQTASPLMQVNYTYPDKQVLLDVYTVQKWQGRAQGVEQQEIKWVALQQLKQVNFPPANRRIVTRLLLPDACVISRTTNPDIDTIRQIINECQHLPMLQLRLENNDHGYLTDIIKRIQEDNTEGKLQLVLNGVPEDSEKYNIHGVHLKAHRLFEYAGRPLSDDYILGASCHNEEELEQAQKLDVDYVFISPVKNTATHPGVAPLGWQAFMGLCAKSSKPVYALGGIQPGDLAIARQHGATGIAMIEAVWGSKDPCAVVRSLLAN
ncbi:MAG: Nudix family hydrolase [Gammaproteobacteria bacterium]